MLRYLLASTAVLAVTAQMAAAEDITTKRTSPLNTSTVKAGAPDAIKITKDGSVVIGSGTAVTMDSNHAVTNEGAVTITGTAAARGIVAVAGTSGDIVNSGTITVDEDYTPTDTDKDGDLDGPFAIGSDRVGIDTQGAHSGRIANSGTIKVEGNDSAGIRLGGPLNGSLSQEGTLSVLGDGGVGVSAGDITGNVKLAGTTAVQGEGSVGAIFNGDIGGAMVVQGTVSSTGYRYTTVPSDASKLDADDLLQGGSALVIGGDVAGGIHLAAPAAEKEGETPPSAKVLSFGAAPAMVIGAAGRDVAVGSIANTASGYGLLIDGLVQGSGLYSGVEGNGLVVGGQGGGVTIAKGIGIAGTVRATAKGASATALRLGAGANVPEMQISGTVEAAGGSNAGAVSTAVSIDQGASLPVLRNSGTIKATAGGEDATAIAIVDRSGTLGLIENSGAISATGAKKDTDRNVAIDLSGNAGGVTIRQTQVGSTYKAPSIEGDILLGAGDDRLEVADGTVAGTVRFGGGANALALSGDAVQSGAAIFGSGNDAMSLAGTSRFSGSVDFGGGTDSLTLGDTASFTGSLTNAQGLAIAVNGGTLNVTNAATVGSLSVAESGILAVTLDKDAGEGTALDVIGTAAFAKGATLSLRLGDVEDAEGRYVVLEAGSITGMADITTKSDLIPFLFKAELAEDAAPNSIAVDVARKTTSELGLNRSQSSAFDAVFVAIGADDKIEDVFLGITDGNQFRQAVRQMLPDHAGGAFEGISLGTRAFARQVADPHSPVYSLGGIDILFSAAGWTSGKDEGASASYDLDGFGFSAGAEIDTGVGAFGASATWFWNEYDNGSNDNRVLSDTYELAAYWRGKWGGFSAYGRGSIGMVDLRGRRTFRGMAGETAVERNTVSEWDATLMTFSGGASYEFGSNSLFLRPTVSFDYLKLKEDGYTDKGGEGLNLMVEDRSSDEFAVNAGLAGGIDFIGKGRGDRNWFRAEAEGGWREIVGGSLGATTAKFEDGEAFTLDPEQLASGWYGRLRAMGGSEMFEIGGEVGAEERHEKTALSLRGTLRMAF